MYAMNANVDSTVLRSFYYNPYVTQGVGHTPSYYAGGGAGHGLNPLYMGSGYAAAIASLYSGLPSAAALGPVDRDDGVEKLIEGFGKLCIGERTVTERVRRAKGGSAGDLERYEENLCLLMQDFERKARHEYVLTREWPKPECEEAALRLSGRLDGVEWRKVAWRPGYMEELDLLWRAKVKFAKRDQVYQVVWEFVAGMARVWVPSNERHRHCYHHDGTNKFRFYLERVPSAIHRENKYFRPEGRTPRHSGGYLPRWTPKSS